MSLDLRKWLEASGFGRARGAAGQMQKLVVFPVHLEVEFDR